MPLQATSGAASYDAFGGGVPVVTNYIEDVFSTYLYTGNGSTQTITNGIDLSGKGGLVWGKSRSNAYDHFLADSVRGSSKLLYSNNTYAQQTDANVFSAFNSNGFSLGVGGAVSSNTNGATYTSWTFRKQPKFFDVVTYTGNGTLQNIAHNLGSTPGCILVKSTSAVHDWAVYHRSLGATQFLKLNSTASAATASSLWNNTNPSSTTFTVGSDGDTNDSGTTYVAYIFAHDAGGFGTTGTDNIVSCGSVTYDSTNGNTINLGYEAQFVILKSATAVTQWYMQDIMRGMASGPDSGARLFPNLSSAEDTSFIVGPTATGFNIKPSFFSNGNNVIYIAIRRGPMKTPTLGTTVFSPTTYTGNGADPRTISAGFPPDLVINTSRTDANVYPARIFYDRLRGNNNSLVATGTQAENGFFATSVLGFNSGQLSHTVGGSATNNSASVPYLDYSFKRAPSYMDVVCYTGTGASSIAITHNLQTTPELIITKCRSTGGNWWLVYSATLGANKYLSITNNGTAAAATGAVYPTAPTSTTFYVNGTFTDVGGSGLTYVSYLFSTCVDVSKVGSYTGTGALQTVNCGFTSGARFVMIKRTDSTGDWWTYDSARGITSGNDPYIFMNSPANEVTGTNYVDTDTTGFQVTAAAPAGLNASGGTYIFLAIA